jgi:hypothetical protein
MKKIDNYIKLKQNKKIKLKKALLEKDKYVKTQIAITVGGTNLQSIGRFGLKPTLMRLITECDDEINKLYKIKCIYNDILYKDESLDKLIKEYNINKKSVLTYLEHFITKCTQCGNDTKKAIYFKNEFLCRNCLCPNEDRDRLLVSTVENLHTMHCGDFIKR